MKPNIFMSYSRREVGFVDDLTYRLEKENFKVWLDYRTLVPGTPWRDQIEAGLKDSEVVLLVVSKDSMESKYVELEWRHFLGMKKRLILLIFEAVDLPKELEIYEWVDFRGDYEIGLKELFSQLEQPIKEEHSVPERGFKMPRMVRIAFGLSLIVAVFSLFAAWSLFVPWFLIPLPYRILKRNYNFAEVQTALWILPLALFLTAAATGLMDANRGGFFMLATFLSLFFVFPLIFILRSKAMQRWGKPEATMAKFANPYQPKDITPTPVSFFIDHAPQDRLVAKEMTTIFEKYGHTSVSDIHSAQTVFALLSTYKIDTDADPENQVVFPVLIQTVEPAQKLSKIQWIDFRGGVRNLDAMARLLGEPANLLAALGIRPLGNQMVLPPVVSTMRYFVILIGVFTAGAILQYLNDFFNAGLDSVVGNTQFRSMLVQLAVTLLLMGGLTFFMVRHLTARKGWFASFFKFSMGLAAIGILVLSLASVDIRAGNALTSAGHSISTGLGIAFAVFGYIIGGVVMAVFLLFRFRDARRWFPVKVK